MTQKGTLGLDCMGGYGFTNSWFCEATGWRQSKDLRSGSRAQELHFPGGLAQPPEAELSEGRDLRMLACEALVQHRWLGQ